MNVLSFDNPEFGQVRTIAENDTVLFCGKDVATALGYKKPFDAISAHCRYTVKRGIPHPQAPDKTIEMLFIPEGDVYRLAASSKLPAADKFERWIFDEVLPTIRKTGGYMIPTLTRASVDTLNGIARIMRAADIPMKDQGSPPEARARQAQLIMDTYNIPHIPDYVKRNPWEPEQLALEAPAPAIQIGRIKNITVLPLSE